MENPSSDWATDERLFASLPGGQAVIDWFGFCPDFHDGILERLELSGANAAITVRTWRMGPAVDTEGYFVRERLALVTLRLLGVSGVKLEGDAGSIISELLIRRVEADPPPSDWQSCAGPVRGDMEIAFDTAMGLYGTMYTKGLAFELHPLSEVASA